MSVNTSFDKRLSNVVRNHERMQRNGIVRQVGRDGLIRSRPRLIRRGLFSLRSWLKSGLILATVLIALKALLFAQMGPDSYALKVEGLRAGSILEQAGAVVMQPEPMTIALGDYLSLLLFQR